jgi:2-oxoglutarate ferredoxin oxidoreductase subunit gamma
MIASGFYEEVILAGFGGQGVILSGKLLAQTAMKNGWQVTYMPAYGAEVRGGTANCMVVLADKPIATPMIVNPTVLVALNVASFAKFTPQLRPGGLLVMNSSLIAEAPGRDDLDVLAIPADQLAQEVGSPRSANMVALGAYLGCRGIDAEAAAACLSDVLAERYHQTIPANAEALRRGAAFARQHAPARS